MQNPPELKIQIPLAPAQARQALPGLFSDANRQFPQLAVQERNA